MFRNIKVANAQASVENDRVRILQLVENSVGFAALDGRVVDFLRDWVVSKCEAHLAEVLQVPQSGAAVAAACQHIGNLLVNFGKLERAAEAYGRQRPGAVYWSDQSQDG